MLPTPNIQFSFEALLWPLEFKFLLLESHGGGEKEQRSSETDI